MRSSTDFFLFSQDFSGGGGGNVPFEKKEKSSNKNNLYINLSIL